MTEVLGEGGMGIVYAAYDAELDRKVALKLLHPRRGATQVGRDRLLREAQAMAKLDHPNVVTVFDVGTIDDRTYVAMELVVGETLARWLRRTKPRWPAIVTVFLGAARGLLAAHREGLVHRDFKPDNVMLGPHDRVRVMDFGIARSEHGGFGSTGEDAATSSPALDQTPANGTSRRALLERVTRTGAMLGTPAYMAPEQFAMTEIGAPADQFAFCVALWEALHGQRPFVGESLPELAAAVTSGRIGKPPPGSGVAAPRWLRRALVRGLAVDPAQRWPSMQVLITELERGLGSRRWWRFAAGAAVGAVALGAIELVGMARVHAAHDACAEQAASIDDTWGPQARARLAGVLVDGASPSASAAFDRAMIDGDRIAQEWTQTYRAACDASVDAPDPAWPEIQACLDDRAAQLASLVDVLADGGVESGVQRLAPMLLRLDAADACLDPSFRARQPPRGGEDDALRPRLWRLEALDRAGVQDETFDGAIDLANVADLEQRPEIAVRAQIVAAGIESERGDFTAAQTRLQDTFDRALAMGDDAAAISATASLVSVVGVKLSKQSEGLTWARIGSSLVARTDASRGFPALRLGNAIGLLHRAHGRLDEAERAHRDGLAIKREIYGAEHPDVVLSLDNLGIVYREQGRIAESIATHRESLALREAALGRDHSDVATTLNNLATAYEEGGEYDAAVGALQRSLRIRETALGPTSRSVATTLSNLGLVHERAGDHDEAEAALLRAKAIYETGTPDLRMLSLVQNNLGLVYRSSGRRDQALAAFTETLALRRRLVAADHPLMAAAYNNLGLLANEAGDLDAAERWYGQALAIYEVHGGNDLATAHANLGEVYRQRRRFDDAKRSFTRSVEIIEDFVGRDALQCAFGLLGLARVALDEGDAVAASALAERALAIREGATVDPVLVAEAQWIAAEAKAKTGATQDAIVLAKRALATVEGDAGEAWPTLRADVLALLAKLEPAG